MPQRIADNTTRTKHAEEIAFFNALIIDLKKYALRLNMDDEREFCVGLTMARLNEATQMLAKLEQCKEQVKWK